MRSSVCFNKYNSQTKLARVCLIQLTKQLKCSVLKERKMDEAVSCFLIDKLECAAISQKHALVLVLYDLKFMLHSTTDTKFGTRTTMMCGHICKEK